MSGDRLTATPRKVRSIFISDVHLGTRGCQADRLIDFLRDHEAEYLYLVGDIIDLWAMSRNIHWTAAQNTVVQKILRRARHGQHVMLIPGNHDEALREYDGVSFGDILVKQEHVHVTADGRRLLVIHGDEFDQVTRYHKWLAIAGDVSYSLLVQLNSWISFTRRILKIPGYWSLAGFAKSRVKKAVSFIFDFEDSVVRSVQHRGLDGVICGHIHSAAIKRVNGLEYINCGDWVDSCTAIVEHMDGRLELVHSSLPALEAPTAPIPFPLTAPPMHSKVSALEVPALFPGAAKKYPANTFFRYPAKAAETNP